MWLKIKKKIHILAPISFNNMLCGSCLSGIYSIFSLLNICVWLLHRSKINNLVLHILFPHLLYIYFVHDVELRRDSNDFFTLRQVLIQDDFILFHKSFENVFFYLYRIVTKLKWNVSYRIVTRKVSRYSRYIKWIVSLL